MDKSYYQRYEPVFGVWKIGELIGEGSFGKVYRLEREDFGVKYRAALKVITVPASASELAEVRADGMDDASVRAYFGAFVKELVQEFELMSRLKGNSNVVSYENHQVIEHKDGIGWDILIQMELLTPLNEYSRTHSVTRQDVIRLGIDLCRALELCQKYNVIHRDVKPENIFISEAGDFKLGDFGIARTVEKTSSGLSKKGTYTYMAPEVYKGEAYGSTVDIYSLGIVLYRLLNGNRTPFLPAAPAYISPADRENALMKRMLGAEIPRPKYADGRLAEIVLKACAFSPKERYASPSQMRQELEAILYSREEGKYIYPEGDEVPQDSYVSEGGKASGAASTSSASVGSGASGSSGTVSGFGARSGSGASGSSGTVSGFSASGGFSSTAGAPVKKKRRGRWVALACAVAALCFVAAQLFGEQLAALIEGRPSLKSLMSWSGTEYLEEVTDSKGNVLREPSFKIDGGVGVLVRVYDGDQISEVYRCDLLGTCESYSKYVRDASGNLEICHYGADGQTLEGRSLYKYNGDGDVISIESYDEDGKLSWREENNYDTGDENSYWNYRWGYDESGEVAYRYSELLELDEQGRTQRVYSYDEDGEIESWTRYERAEDGSYKRYSYDGNDTLQSSSEIDALGRTVRNGNYYGSGESETVYVYDEGGFCVREEDYSAGQLSLYTLNTFNERGKRVAEERYSADGTIERKEQYNEERDTVRQEIYEGGALESYYEIEYDEQNREVRRTRYSADGRVTLVDSTVYEGDGRRETMEYYGEDGALRSMDVWVYGADRRTNRWEQYDENRALESYTLYTRGDEGEILRAEEYDANDVLTGYTLYTYDDEGRETSVEYRDGSGALKRYTLTEYDEGKAALETFGLPSDAVGEYDRVVMDFDGDGNLTSYYISHYDAKGGWISNSHYWADGTEF